MIPTGQQIECRTHARAGRAWCLVALGLLLYSVPTMAAVAVSLPLEGYYRPGRYMPVRFSADAAKTGTLRLGGEGIVPTHIDLSHGPAEGVAPILPLEGTSRQVMWEANGQREMVEQGLRPLGVDQRLVGVVGLDVEAVRGLFAGKTIIPIQLDPANILPGSPAAWGALDGLVLDSASAGQLSDERLMTLLASGILVAVRSPASPDGKWPWKQQGEYWVLAWEAAGPAGSGMNASAFSAVQGWEADWPAALRWRIILYAVVFSILILAAALLRVKYAAILGVAVAVTTVLLLAWWWSGRSAVLERSGEVVVLGEKLAQGDRWIYRSAARETETVVPWSGLTCPFFEDEPFLDGQGDCEVTATTLLCHGNGEPIGFTARCASGLKLGFLLRVVTPTVSMAQLHPPGRNPLILLAQRLYLRPDVQVAGELPAPPSPRAETNEVFPPLVLNRSGG